MTVTCATPGWVHKDLGAGHHMWTQAELHDNRWLTGYTRIATFTRFGGFHGSVTLACVDGNGMIVSKTPDVWRYGVDGTWVGVSDRTEAWWNYISEPPDLLGRTTSIVPIQFWDPQWQLLQPLLQAGMYIAQALAAAG